MKKSFILIFSLFIGLFVSAQTPLTEAVNFHVKTLQGTPYWLFDLLDEDKIVVIDFFTTSCGPCQEYAPSFQEAYEEFGENQSNVFFMGINYGENNEAIREFDSIFGLSYPSVSGSQGGGTNVYELYEVESYPTIIVITPDQEIVVQFLWPPTTENIIDAVVEAGGLYVGTPEISLNKISASVFPNPVVDQSFLEFSMSHEASVDFQIINLMGKIIYQSEKSFAQKGTNQVALPTNTRENGLYFIRLRADEAPVHTIQFVVAR